MLVQVTKSFIFNFVTAFVFLFCFAVIGINAQTIPEEQATASAQTKTEELKSVPIPVLQDYKGIKIGMTQDEVRDKLGKPEVNDATGYFYVFSDDERAQIGFDADKKVNMIAVFYSADNEKKPQYADVFGPDSTAVAKDDGSIYNLVSYPQAGYWVAYSRLPGDDALVTVTMQKIQNNQ